MSKTAFFGTSHTCGDCAEEPTGYIPNPWPKLVDDTAYNYSMSGATNFELSVIINEAFSLNYLDDVNTVILEPRLSFSALMWNRLEENLIVGNDPLIKSTTEFTNTDADCAHHYFTTEVGTGDFMNDERIRRKVFGKNGNLISKMEINDIKQSVTTYLVNNGNTNSMLYQNLNFVKTIMLLCKAYNKEFYWIDWELPPHVDIHLHSMFDDVMNCCLNPDKSVKGFILDKNKNYVCSCGHLNAKAQPLIAEFIKERLDAKRTNN